MIFSTHNSHEIRKLYYASLFRHHRLNKINLQRWWGKTSHYECNPCHFIVIIWGFPLFCFCNPASNELWYSETKHAVSLNSLLCVNSFFTIHLAAKNVLFHRQKINEVEMKIVNQIFYQTKRQKRRKSQRNEKYLFI